MREIAGEVAREAGYRLVVLFGSSARDEPNPSDLDIGIEATSPLDGIDAVTPRPPRVCAEALAQSGRMTPLEMAVVRRKLRRIRGNIGTLASAIEGIDAAAYARDELLKRAVERLLQETIDAAVDVNNHLLRSIGQPPAEDYFGSFVQLGRCGLMDSGLADSLAPAAGLRDRIVHEYEELDDEVVLQAAQHARDRFSAYIAAVENYLGASGR